MSMIQRTTSKAAKSIMALALLCTPAQIMAEETATLHLEGKIESTNNLEINPMPGSNALNIDDGVSAQHVATASIFSNAPNGISIDLKSLNGGLLGASKGELVKYTVHFGGTFHSATLPAGSRVNVRKGSSPEGLVNRKVYITVQGDQTNTPDTYADDIEVILVPN
ncbi:hypothetical protein ACQZV8_08795 [Magnetococcales bacterium HHB-1]